MTSEQQQEREITDHRSQLLRREERNIDQKSELLGAPTFPPPPHPLQLQVKYYVIHSQCFEKVHPKVRNHGEGPTMLNGR